MLCLECTARQTIYYFHAISSNTRDASRVQPTETGDSWDNGSKMARPAYRYLDPSLLGQRITSRVLVNSRSHSYVIILVSVSAIVSLSLSVYSKLDTCANTSKVCKFSRYKQTEFESQLIGWCSYTRVACMPDNHQE